MKEYNFNECDCKIYGIPNFEKTHKFRRLTDDIVKIYPHLKDPDNRPVGARLRFRTDSPVFSIRMELENVYTDRGMSFYQANVANVFEGIFPDSKYLGIVSAPNSYDDNYIYAEFKKSEGTQDITVFLPRNPTVKNIKIGVEDGFTIFAPTPYKYEKPVLFYGSSITENGHTSSSNAYTALLSRWLDTDYLNFGFSGAARGEKEIAEYLCSFDCSVFVLDYDHNAPDTEHLRKTHEPFFKIIRSAKPDLPVIMMTRPADDTPETDERFEIVNATYKNAVLSGDKNVYLIDGRTFLDGVDREVCTTDLTHPNDLGHYCMAKKICPVLEKLIK